ncbi:hypothetical protein B0H14DRAFT_3487241 [Mycena olivaceomarginata]|nr:hypothetical protein B0H14DRAFT_3487241 [Mycena olivaceomarginata]
MRFLAHAHLVALGLLSLGITAYAQEHCRTSLDCGPNECCNTTELVDLSRSRGPIVDVGARRASCAKKPHVYQVSATRDDLTLSERTLADSMSAAAPLPRQDDPEQGDDDSDQ